MTAAASAVAVDKSDDDELPARPEYHAASRS
jgi:hypothetical protein